MNKSFQDFGLRDFAIFEISNFANLDFSVLPQSAPALGDALKVRRVDAPHAQLCDDMHPR